MEASERKASLELDAAAWRYVRTMVGQLVPARVVVRELMKMGAVGEEAQEKFVAEVLHEHHLQMHPPSSKYLKSLLQLYAREVDNAGEAFSDLFAIELALYNNSYTSSDGPHSNTCFFVADDCVIQCRAAIEHNDVGLRMWEAGLFLTELVYHNRTYFEGKRVLELGAGLGLTSLCAAVAVQTHVMISDYSLPTLANIRYNMEHNTFQPNSHVEDVQLDWCTMTREHAQELNPDIVLAADTVYDKDFIPAFCDTLKHFSEIGGNAGKASVTDAAIDWTATPVILVAATRRNSDTYEIFMRALADRGLVVVNLSETVKAEVPQKLYYGNRDLIQLLQISRAAL